MPLFSPPTIQGKPVVQTPAPADNFVLTFDSATDTWSAEVSVGGGGAPHAILDGSTHTDSAVGTVARGDLITGQSVTPKWTRLAKGAANTVLKSDGTDLAYGTIDNNSVTAAAAIAVNKLAALTASRAVASDASGFLVASTTTSTELGYVNNVTSAIQTQLNAKQATITALTFNDYIPCVLEVPQDTVAYPDVLSLVTGADKITGFWLPNSGTSEINFKCICPTELGGTPAAKLIVYMLPRTTVANSTVNLTISRLYSSLSGNLDTAQTSEAATDFDLNTSTLNYLSIWTFSLTANPTAGQLITGRLKRIPGAANDDFTEDLFIVGIVLQINRAITIT